LAGEKAMAISDKSQKADGKKLKDPRGGLTAAGRKHFKETEGANLRPGVKGAADTPEKMKRKGSFLRRHYANLRGPLQDENGEPTRLALQAQAWGERVPKTEADAKKLADKGSKLLEKYQEAKGKDAKTSTSQKSKKSAPKSAQAG
jgi:hypothetical protein